MASSFLSVPRGVKIKTMARLLLFCVLIHPSQSFTGTDRIRSAVAKIELNPFSSYNHDRRKLSKREISSNKHWHDVVVGKVPSHVSLHKEPLKARSTKGDNNEADVYQEQENASNNEIESAQHENAITSNDSNIATIHLGSAAALHSHHSIQPQSSDNLYMDPIEIIDDETRQKEKRKLKKRTNRMKVSATVSVMFTSLLLLIYLSGPGQWRYYLAGGICAAISHAITTPVDVIKVR